MEPAPPPPPVTCWIPEDDLLLKNSIEAGASLESLAKGAVRFSRRFTVQQLEERWHSLLYDPVISLDAAAHMIAHECTASNVQLKCGKFSNSKSNRSNIAKRKAESVRSRYHAMRKRISSELFNSMDMGFLVGSSPTSYNGNGGERKSEKNIPEVSSTNHLEYQQSHADIDSNPYVYHEPMTDEALDGVAIAFQLGHHERTDTFMEKKNNLDKQSSQIQGHFLNNDHSSVDKVDQTEKTVINQYEVGDLKAKQHSTENINSGFGGGRTLYSPVLDSDLPFGKLPYSSPTSDMSIWTTIESISAPNMPMDDNFSGSNQYEGNAFAPQDDGNRNNRGTSEYDVGHSDPQFHDHNTDMDLKASGPESYLQRISSSLMDFMSDEEGDFVDVDGRGMIDKSYFDGLSLLLLNSPTDGDPDSMPNLTNAEVPKTPIPYVAPSEGIYPEGVHNVDSSHYTEAQEGVNYENQDPSYIPSLSRVAPEVHNGYICCVLNTEDPEIPCNDDILLPNQIPSSNSFTLQNLWRPNYVKPSLGKECLDDCKPKGRTSGLSKRDRQNTGKPLINPSSTNGLGHPLDDYGAELELPKFEPPHLMSRSLNSIHLDNTAGDSFLLKVSKDETLDLGSGNNNSQIGVDFRKREIDSIATIQVQASQSGVGNNRTSLQEAAAYDSISDQDKEISDCDDDVPYFSDVEAMILDMDLVPDDQEVYLSKEVLSYQHEGTKKAIMRLEQAARSYMQRAIVSHGAFAVVYGRNLKHYIKKPEVLIGRATEDNIVDIDLRGEGCANKVSRKQAIIRMGKDGTFCLRNLGKRSIFMNGQEVSLAQIVRLNSGSLIEIQGMAFIFETDQTSVKHYLDSLTKERQRQQPGISNGCR